MLRQAMPHKSFNPDGAISYPEEIRPTQADPMVPLYDWLIEMLGQDVSEPWVKEKVWQRGWKIKSFENYRKFILDKYKTTDVKVVYNKMFAEDGELPVWDRTSETATRPIGWYSLSTQSYRRGDEKLHEELLHEDKPDPDKPLSLVVSWIRRECRIVS